MKLINISLHLHCNSHVFRLFGIQIWVPFEELSNHPYRKISTVSFQKFALHYRKMRKLVPYLEPI